MITDLQIFPIDNDELRKKILIEAEKDGRTPIHMTHVVMKKGEIVGTFCTASPTLFWWMHSEKTTNRDSCVVLQSVETLMNEQRTPNYVMPCHPKSNYYKTLISRVGDGLEVYKGDSDDDWTLFIRK
tara:strand:- start:465 stop:845 length:381 start_codon:yes stop_codon:yes gene_type:complete